MKLSDVVAENKVLLIEVEKHDDTGLTFHTEEDKLSVGKILSAGSLTGDFLEKVGHRVIFATDSSMSLGFGFQNAKFIHMDDVLASLGKETNELENQ